MALQGQGKQKLSPTAGGRLALLVFQKHKAKQGLDLAPNSGGWGYMTPKTFNMYI